MALMKEQWREFALEDTRSWPSAGCVAQGFARFLNIGPEFVHR